MAVMPSGGMSREALNCKDFSSVGSSGTLDVSEGQYVNVQVGNETVAAIQMPTTISGQIIYLGSNEAVFVCVYEDSVIQ